MPEKHKCHKYYGWQSERLFLDGLAEKRNKKALVGYITGAKLRLEWGSLDKSACVAYAKKLLKD